MLVLVILLIGGSLVGVAFHMVESRNRQGFLSIAQNERYNLGVSALENGKNWLHRYIATNGNFPERTKSGLPVKSSDLVVHRTKDYVVCDLLYPLPPSMDVSLVGFPKWEMSTFGGSIAMGDYTSANGGVSQQKGEGPEGIGVYLIRSIQEGGRGYEVVLSEGR